MSLRHAHKGPVARRKALDNIPLLSMSKQEFDDSFDTLHSDIDVSILEEGRKGECQLVFATVLLHTPEQPERLVLYAPEYGDGEGTREMDDFAKRLSRLKLLRPDERLSVVLYECDRT